MEPALPLAEVKALQDAVEEVYVDDIIQHWVVELVRATRHLDAVAIGASVRGTLALERAARMWALLLNGRDYVVPEDVESLFLPVIGHRVLFAHLPRGSAQARARADDERLQDSCLQLAPKPEAHLGGEVLPRDRTQPVKVRQHHLKRH